MNCAMGTHEKVTASHLARTAYLYVRQSTLRQVEQNNESTQRQYGLRQRAVALGWTTEQVEVIDDDLGHSGAHTVDRAGFQRLVSEVGLGKAGIVMGLEVSRLARNSADWHRLLEICALAETLILDEDGLYDPIHFNDRLVLGLKGTMSEAELHLLKARMRGGVLSKARRGELKGPLPVGLVYNDKDEVILDPDQQIQEALRLFFKTFSRTGSACATIKVFREQGLLFPRRLLKGPRKGEVLWDELPHSRALQLLHNPKYAGAFCYGRTHTRKKADGKTTVERLSRKLWHTLLPGAHVGYITWEEFEENQRRLKENCLAFGIAPRKGPPREGPALLQGLVVCGRCGKRMTIHYHQQSGKRIVPEYICQRNGIEHGTGICQRLMGGALDEAMGRLVVDSVTPITLEVALTVQQQLRSRLEEADRLRHKQVERARYETELARRRYMQVDPDNRLVADDLEAEWNDKLRALNEAQEIYEKGCQSDRAILGDKQREAILALAKDFPRLWNDPKTPQRERKRMIRLLIEDVTLIKDSQITAHVRFKGGATQTLTLPLPLPATELWRTSPELIEEIDQLLDHHTCGENATILNERGVPSPKGHRFHAELVARVVLQHGLKGRYERLRAKGLKSVKEVARELGVITQTIIKWRTRGLLKGYPFNDKNCYLYEPIPDGSPARERAKKIAKNQWLSPLPSQPAKEVQYEA
jgi:DNA invertase Pin-like site-specific DNA recombinase/transposase-like protein